MSQLPPLEGNDMELSKPAAHTASYGAPSPTVSVVIPALNEEQNLPHVFAALPAGISEVIVVDGGSIDRTVAVARELRPDVVIVQQTRTGKGNALACGFAACTGDIIVMIDADGSTDPAEIPRFVAELVAGADFVKGSRFSKGGHSHDITKLRKLGNDGLNVVVNVLFGTRFTDLCYGYNAFWRRVVPSLQLPPTSLPRPIDGNKLWGDGFEIETMINIRAAVDGLKVGEVGSIEHARIHGETNLNTFRDGFRVLRTIFSEYGRMRGNRRIAESDTEIIIHHRPVTAAVRHTPRAVGLAKVVNRQTPVAAAHPADVRPHVNHLNRGPRREEVGTRRTDDIKRLQARTALED
jgi:glycosyltransferase involved in cell wall biosynthesis